jgi:hypothetical protein
MGKFLLSCFLGLFVWITTSFGQAGEKVSFQQNEQPFVENTLRQVSNPIEFYPNPSQDDLNVKVNDKNLQNVEFEVYNIIGNSIKIEVEEVAKDLFKIPVRSLSPGYYLLVVQDKDSRFKQAYKFQKK